MTPRISVATRRALAPLRDPLGRALAIAAIAFGRSPAGRAKLLHSLRVALSLPDRLRPAALLHDVVEAGAFELRDLAGLGVPPRTVHWVNALTRRPGETYLDYIRRAGRTAAGRALKLADLADNVARRRARRPLRAADRRKLARYAEARAVLRSMAARGGRWRGT